jgi:nucleoside-diphosphate-sugar epimerase
MIRLLLLGADGFVGHHVRASLAGQPDTDVITVSRRGDVHPDLQLDLTESVAGVSRALSRFQPDVVLNCAGAAVGDAAALAANNVVVTANLVDALLTAGRPIRLVHLGSAAEYGRVTAGVPTREDDPTRPVSNYGLSKLAATRLVRTAATAGLDAVVLRITTPIGPEAPATSIAGRVVGQLRQVETDGGGVTTGPLDDVRDFVDVRDAAEAVMLAALRPAEGPQLPKVLNVGSGRATPVRRMVDALLAIAGFNGGLRMDGGDAARATAVPWQQCDISAIEAALGWRPRRDLDTSLRDLWEASSILTPC